MRLQEENEREVEENVNEEGELVLPNTSEMANPSMWVHANQNILLNSRTIHLDPEPEEGQEEEFDPEVAKKKLETDDPYEPRLKPIDEDDKIKMCGKVKQTPWVIRFEGDQTEYANDKKPASASTLCNGAIVVRSLTWPGAFTIYQNGTQVSVYCGNGLKYDQKTNPFPLNPPSLAVEAEEYEDFAEPNPT